MRQRRWLQSFLVALCVIGSTSNVLAESRWEPSIQKFEAADEKNPPAMGSIVFVGSSSIVFWKTAKDFPEWDIINRGFGGSQTSDSVEFADRIVLKYEPRQVVIYAGDNDIARGKTPENVFDDTKELFGIIHDALPETSIIYVAIKPSIARWNLVDEMREANTLIRTELCEKDDRIEFLDIDTPILGKDGKPMKELFIADGLHMTSAGYKIWNDAIRPLLKKKD
ncbi:MAG: SGNH/GDSL hydrolase family protein [Candidatus Hydrogenedentota bacterium]